MKPLANEQHHFSVDSTTVTFSAERLKYCRCCSTTQTQGQRGKVCGEEGERLLFFSKLLKTKHQPRHQNTVMFSKGWVKPPEKQKQTVQRTVERITRSCLRSKHKREKKKFNRMGSFYDHKEAFEVEGSKEKARERRGGCACKCVCAAWG